MISVTAMVKMKHGDKAVVSESYYGSFWSVGDVIIRQEDPCDDVTSVNFKSEHNDYSEFMQPIELDTYEPCESIDSNLGTYRPELETRKVGKVRVELVDDGFPLALREIAKVMTWAQTAKGYKDHDWQNLPNAEVQLAAAASRHRTDHIIQRVVEGLSIEDCVDRESSLLHKAHEAFGVLAQLELMLRNKL